MTDESVSNDSDGAASDHHPTIAQRPIVAPTRSGRRLSESQKRALERAENNVRADQSRPHVRPSEDMFDESDPRVKEDILRMILQYLREQNFYVSTQAIVEEANMKASEWQDQAAEVRRVKKAILDGEWSDLDKLLAPTSQPHMNASSHPTTNSSSSLPPNLSPVPTLPPPPTPRGALLSSIQRNGNVFRSFQYALYRQQFLELVESKEHQKAFTLLTRRLKPLEHYQSTPTEFRDLCYLLTAKSVNEVAGGGSGDRRVVGFVERRMGSGLGGGFEWEGVGEGRETLVRHFQRMLEFQIPDRLSDPPPLSTLPPHRLLTLLRQAVAYQVEFSPYHPRRAAHVDSLLEDYQCFVLPNTLRHLLAGHEGNVKCAAFAGEEDGYIVSGGGDATVRVWDTDTGIEVAVMEGHGARVWDVEGSLDGEMAVSGSGDGTVKVWDMRSGKFNCVSTLLGAQSDVYTVAIHPSGSHAAASGYDRTTRLHDLTTSQCVRSFSGHTLPVTSLTYTPLGNLLVTGSKDSTVRFWDISSGCCVKELGGNVGEVSGLDVDSTGMRVIAGCKDSSVRVWDVRTGRVAGRFKGHQNTSRNFIRCSFAGPQGSLVFSGSEDGSLHAWDARSFEPLQRLPGGGGIVYGGAWSKSKGMVVSGMEDGAVGVWWYDGGRLRDGGEGEVGRKEQGTDGQTADVA